MSKKYLNRDLSWWQFNDRVLKQACSPRHPLLERLRFLAIASSNYDEFVMKRIGHLQRLIRKNITESGLDKAAPEALFQQLREQALQFNQQRYKILKHLQRQLAHHGVHFISWKDLSAEEKNSACEYFKKQVFPVLTPLAFDSAHPFPFLSNLSFSIGLTLHRPKAKKEHFARIKVPSSLPQWFLADDKKKHYFLSLQELVENNLHACFPNMIIDHVVAFRITRSADVEGARDDMDAHPDIVEEQLRQRRMANIVRLECSERATPHIVSLLQKELGIQERDTYFSQGPLNYQAFAEVAGFNIPGLRYPPWVPTPPPAFEHANTSVLDVIAEQDVLVHHPYESYSDSVEGFVRDAVDDERVMVIKISLYRAGTDNPLIPLLIRAAEEGKQVVCVLELKARFDEAHNIHLGEKLTKKGVHVVYGVVNKKTHAKSILIIRREADGFKYYTHVGTGNYNPKTAKVYSDFALFTSQTQIAAEVLELFNSLTGVSGHANYNELLVAPFNMRQTFVDLIKNEIQHAEQDRPARIVAKMNNFEDKQICDLLYEASQKGVQIDLIVRGFCCLRPQTKGLSENIRVRSVIGQFLEHSRVYYFQSGAEEPKQGQFFIGSADWRYRNFDKRVEVVVPVKCKKNKKQLWAALKIWLNDALAWRLNEEGDYERPEALVEKSAVSAQQQFMHKALKKSHKASAIQWALNKTTPVDKKTLNESWQGTWQKLKAQCRDKQLCVGLIDLGTNSIKLDIAKLQAGQPLQPLHYEKHMVRLGDGVYDTGFLSKPVIKRGLEALDVLKAQLLRHGVDESLCLGTSALRQAYNSDEFVKKVAKKTGLQVQVISGEQEAKMIARGVLHDTSLQNKTFVVADIGGGSTEFIFCSRAKTLKAFSEPLGVNQILQRCPEKQDLHNFFDPLLRDVLAGASCWPSDTRGEAFVVGTSGTMRSLWRLINGVEEGPVNSTDSSFDALQLDRLIERLWPLGLDELKQLPGLEPQRADLILGGAVLVQRVLKLLECQRVQVHSASLRDGVWHELGDVAH